MDHLKTTFPKLEARNKIIYGFSQLPITLTRMIVHGDGDKPFA
jgi:hypothetical protein